MVTYTPDKLSASASGRNIKVAATATPGTLIHTEASTSGKTLVYLWAMNSSASDVKLTIEWGGVTAPDDLVEFTVPAEDGAYVVIPGWYLTSGVLVRAFAATGNVILINGHVTEID